MLPLNKARLFHPRSFGRRAPDTASRALQSLHPQVLPSTGKDRGGNKSGATMAPAYLWLHTFIASGLKPVEQPSLPVETSISQGAAADVLVGRALRLELLPGSRAPRWAGSRGEDEFIAQLCSSHEGGRSFTAQKNQGKFKFSASNQPNRFSGVPSMECSSHFRRPTRADPDDKM